VILCYSSLHGDHEAVTAVWWFDYIFGLESGWAWLMLSEHIIYIHISMDFIFGHCKLQHLEKNWYML